MNYFLIETDPLYVDAQVLQDWNGKVDRTKIKPGLSHQLPARIILNIYPNAYTTFTDIVDFPFLLLSKVCMDVVKLYEPQIVSKQIILLDTENRNKQTYYLPILPHFASEPPWPGTSAAQLLFLIAYSSYQPSTAPPSIVFVRIGVTLTPRAPRLSILSSTSKRTTV